MLDLSTGVCGAHMAKTLTGASNISNIQEDKAFSSEIRTVYLSTSLWIL